MPFGATLTCSSFPAMPASSRDWVERLLYAAPDGTIGATGNANSEGTMTVRSLQHIALAVPDATVGKKFYTDFGMEGRELDKRIVMRCQGRDQDQVILVEGKKKQMHHVCFGTKAGDLDGLKKRLAQAGMKLVDAPKETPGEGIWFRDPDGLLVNVRVAEAAKWRTVAEWKINNPGHLNRAGVPGHPKRDVQVRPTRLGHALRSEEHTSELQSQSNLVCRLLLEKKKIVHSTRVTT